MRAVRRFFRRFAAWRGTESTEERLRAEIEGHLALQTADNLRAGLSPAEAKRQAVLKFGPVEATKEDCRDETGLRFLETTIQDSRYSLRCLRRAPVFTITVVLTLNETYIRIPRLPCADTGLYRCASGHRRQSGIVNPRPPRNQTASRPTDR